MSTISIQKFRLTGELQYKYSALQNMLDEDAVLSGFKTSKIKYDFLHPIEIECQQSYDDSINLIINNDDESPKLINSRFAKLENNTYEYIVRNQGVPSNVYNTDYIDEQTDLFLRSDVWPIIDLEDIINGGSLKGGNYTFYIKYADEDDNESDVMCESGVISIFHGNTPKSINGTLMDEITSKSIILKINNVDLSYSKFYLYYIRETSDLNGFSITKAYKITKPYNIKQTIEITINGLETVNEISIDELNIKYNYYEQAKTHAVIQNMLFLGNLKNTKHDYNKLQQLSYWIDVSLHHKKQSIGYINNLYSPDYYGNSEYYDCKNLYYFLGYWPDEYYKLGVVYLLKDGTQSPAFLLRGRQLTIDESNNLEYNPNEILEVNTLLNTTTWENTGGIFKTPKTSIINHARKEVNPLFFRMHMSEQLQKDLYDLGVVGYFFVRTPRVPTNLFQGLTTGVDDNSGFLAPYLYLDQGADNYIESFVDKKHMLNGNWQNRFCVVNNIKHSALLSLDTMSMPQLQTLLNWTDYKLELDYVCVLEQLRERHFAALNYFSENHERESKLVYIPSDIPSFAIGDAYFSTRAGNAESVRDFSFINIDNISKKTSDILRGISCPIIGTDTKLINNGIYTIKTIHNQKSWIESLMNSPDSFYAISNRYKIELSDITHDVYRGDCYTNTTTIRLWKNFMDPTFPTNNKIVDESCWNNGFNGLNKTTEENWETINLGDVNAVPLGIWVTFKCLSNYNLGPRVIDKQNMTYINKLGTYGTFYPISNISVKSTSKTPETQLLNDGYSKTLGKKMYVQWNSIPYDNQHFENRIAFSNVASTKMFTNGFRIFQGLSYQDVDKSFGSITKLFPYGQNLLCVFEHGLAIIPINEKALLSTQEGLSIHLYGAGVLQEQVSVISPDYGSTWMDSLIKTPNAYYGVDASARKIWKYNNTEGFVCISDFKVQSQLNKDLNFSNISEYFSGASNIKTHFNKFKNDVIFTFYKEDKMCALCYNEVLKMWVSRYSWTPLLSANIDNDFYSFDRNKLSLYLNQYKSNTDKSSIYTDTIYYKSGEPINLYYNHSLYDDVEILIDQRNEDDDINTVKLYLNVEFIPTDELLPIRTDVYINKDGEKIITPNSPSLKYKWEVIPPTDLSKRWYYISCKVDYEEKFDINGESFLRATIYPKDWSDFILYSSTETVDNQNGTHKLYLNPELIDDGEGELIYPIIDVNLVAEYNEKQSKVYKTLKFYPKDTINTSMFLYKHDINSNICNWYESQHPFEYEFVVNQPAGFHKIFNNLMIISNNVEPDSLEVEIVGDVYDFKEEFISQNENIKYKFPIISLPNNKTYQTKLTLDKVTNEHRLLMHQGCLNIKDFGRRLGNISYIEGKWYIVLQPIYYEDKTLKTTRLRDKWAKIRIKYSGEKLAIITAIQTLMNISYA